MVTPAQALTLLREGNHRFATGNAAHPRQHDARREELFAGQHPHSCVLSCADSRVSPEIIFDQGLGDIFTIRNGGHVPSPTVVASVEFAHVVTGAALVVVLGHERCKAIEFGRTLRSGGHVELPGSLRVLTDSVVELLADDDGSPFPTVAAVVRELRASPVLCAAEAAGKLRIAPAGYFLDGRVQWLDDKGEV